MSNKVPLTYLPGVCRVNSSYASSMQQGGFDERPAAGRFTDMDKIEFIAGFPQKIGGWTKLFTDPVTGLPRGVRDWKDNAELIYLAVGTNTKLFYYLNDARTDITPLKVVVTGTVNNPFDTTITSTTVVVNHTAHGQQNGDPVILTAAAAVGGLTIAGVYFVANKTANTYEITANQAASATVSGGGGSTAYSYYRITLTNPFTTTNASTSVSVAHTAHLASVGDSVTYNGASAVGGLTIDGEYTVTSVTNANTYTITAASQASSGASGGGTVNAIYQIPIGPVDSVTTFGYGAGPYGMGNYGQDSTTTGIDIQARIWSLYHYGQQLLANPSGGSIYVYDPSIGGRAYQLYGAPAKVGAMVVTPERFVFALGVNSLDMEIAWPDQTDYTEWTSLPTNTANEGRTLQEGARLVGGIPVRDGVTMVLSSTSAYSFSYAGDNFVYHTDLLGTGCGLCGPLAIAVMGGVAYWFGTSELWKYDGSVQPLPTDDIRDEIFQFINLQQKAKFVVGTNIAKKQIWFFWADGASTENNRYAIYHVDQNCFSLGTMERLSWIDKNLFTLPIGIDSTGYVFSQESGKDGNGVQMNSFLEFSPVDISKGDVSMDIFAFFPDVERQTGDMTFEITTKEYPQSTGINTGQNIIAADGSNARIDLRLNGRLVGFTMASNILGGDFRLGVPMIEIQPAGARR